MNAISSQHLFRQWEAIYNSRVLFFFFFLTLFKFNLFQSTFDIKTRVKYVYFRLLHYFLYMSLHGFVIPRCGHFIKFELFSSPKGREFDQKIAKKFKCRTFTRTPRLLSV